MGERGGHQPTSCGAGGEMRDDGAELVATLTAPLGDVGCTSAPQAGVSAVRILQLAAHDSSRRWPERRAARGARRAARATRSSRESGGGRVRCVLDVQHRQRARVLNVLRAQRAHFFDPTH